MKRRFKPLDSTIRLCTAAADNVPIMAYAGIECMGEGLIEDVDAESVVIRSDNGEKAWYQRNVCAFYVK